MREHLNGSRKISESLRKAQENLIASGSVSSAMRRVSALLYRTLRIPLGMWHPYWLIDVALFLAPLGRAAGVALCACT